MNCIFFLPRFRETWRRTLRVGITGLLLLLSTIFTNADRGKAMAETLYAINGRIVDALESTYAVYTLHQEEKAFVEIVPALGNNCYVFKVADGETWINLIDPPPDLATLEERPTAYGNPILFPFPNRIRDGRWQFEGETYQFDKTPESPTTIPRLTLEPTLSGGQARR